MEKGTTTSARQGYLPNKAAIFSGSILCHLLHVFSPLTCYRSRIVRTATSLSRDRAPRNMPPKDLDVPCFPRPDIQRHGSLHRQIEAVVHAPSTICIRLQPNIPKHYAEPPLRAKSYI